MNDLVSGRAPSVGDRLEDVELQRADGTKVMLGELVLDADQNLYRAIELRRFPWWKMLDPLTWRNHLRSLRRARQGRITNHPLQSPGVVVLDGNLRVLSLHRGETTGDYLLPARTSFRSGGGG